MSQLAWLAQETAQALPQVEVHVPAVPQANEHSAALSDVQSQSQVCRVSQLQDEPVQTQLGPGQVWASVAASW